MTVKRMVIYSSRYLYQISDRPPIIPNKRSPSHHSQQAIAPPHPKNSDSYGAQRLRTPTSPKKRFLRSATLTHLRHPKSELLAAAQRLRTSHLPKKRSLILLKSE